MQDNADPLNGWSLKEVEDTSIGPAAADIYGKLFYHVSYSTARIFSSSLGLAGVLSAFSAGRD